MNTDIPVRTLYEDQEKEIGNYNPEVYKMVSQCFTNIESAAILLSANGMFLKYAGQSIRNNLQLVKIAVNQNGDSIAYASTDLLMSDPAIAAELIMSATYGHPCEAFASVIKNINQDYLFEVSKKIVEMDNNMVSWVSHHMYNGFPYSFVQEKEEALSAMKQK